MTKLNEHYLNLQGSYLFAEVARRTAAYKAAHPQQEVISLGIGDVSRPLVPAVVSAMKKACDEMGQADTFRGYGPYEGYDFLRQAIARGDYQSLGVDIEADEIFVSDGAKSDVANFQEIFDARARVALQDPVYPVYLDTNVMAGRSGACVNGQFEKIIYLPCTAENHFAPALPKEHADVIYLCSPNNPTGTAMTRAQLSAWVEWAARKKQSFCLTAPTRPLSKTPTPRTAFTKSPVRRNVRWSSVRSPKRPDLRARVAPIVWCPRP